MTSHDFLKRKNGHSNKNHWIVMCLLGVTTSHNLSGDDL